MTALRAVSYGGGVQSTALLVLAATGRIDFPLFLMANVGDDSEHPDTLTYVREIAMPYAEAHGIEVQLLDRVKRDGTVETLWGRLMDDRPCPHCKGTPPPPTVRFCGRCAGSGIEMIPAHTPDWCDVCDGPCDFDEARPERLVVCRRCRGRRQTSAPGCARCHDTGRVQSRSLPIPVRMSNGAPGTRSCTADFKIKVIGKELKRRGATAENPATVGIGISLDEIQRANARRVEPHERIVYPLIGIGEETGLKLNRLDCERVIRDAGLPVPPKSSCFFCPFHRPTAWADLAREHPELWEKSIELEDTLNERRRALGKDEVFLTRYGVPLREAIDTDQELLPLIDDGSCDSGWCFT